MQDNTDKLVVGETSNVIHAELDIIKLLSDSNNSPVSIRRKKYVHWSDEEHRLFLVGLQIYGKGDWKNIARYIGTKKEAKCLVMPKSFSIG
uniref:Uncharacterized protein n=1 Tax=Cajanus cajan TaxID=3821 RepID=A0A151T0L9_CAJCA|nr:hypothetical protein KK1_023002 [Cajanus cajan]